VTPLQLISAICSIVNGGKLYQPYFVDSIIGAQNEVVYKKSQNILKKTISQETSEIMKNMMLEVIKQYSGFNAFIPGYEVGGKTGTTQKYSDGKISGEYIASFVGTFPAQNPDYVILIVVDEPGGVSYYGSIAATPYAKLIIEDIIKYKDYKPSGNIIEDLNMINNKIQMPNVLGLNLFDGVKVLEEKGLQVEIQGEGSIIKNQFPACDECISVNSVVVICVE
jgi:stage V sporulation protein D (sporulation-specific penicillin-binding protein)